MSKKFLTTGQAAKICSVTPDTILKWIHSGTLPARRTAGGHHRILSADLENLLQNPPTHEATLQHLKATRHFRYCWEYNGNGKLLESCKNCGVYLMRAFRCYQVAKLAPQVGHPKVFCKETCEECEYYRKVHAQTTNVLVVTDNPELGKNLKNHSKNTSFNLEIADCEYACSAKVNEFRPDFAVIDCSMGKQQANDITNHLIQDPRIPFIRVVLAGNAGEFPKECDKQVFARITKPFTIKDISECVTGTVTGTDDNPMNHQITRGKFSPD